MRRRTKRKLAQVKNFCFVVELPYVYLNFDVSFVQFVDYLG